MDAMFPFYALAFMIFGGLGILLSLYGYIVDHRISRYAGGAMLIAAAAMFVFMIRLPPMH